jgi:putative endopeptidase
MRNLDTRADACRDFFQYANGGWLKSNPIPAAYSAWSLDDEINERNQAILKRVLEDAAARHGEHGSPAQKIGDFYTAAMDAAGIERVGIAPLQDDLAAVATLHAPADVAALIMTWQLRGDDVLFEFEAKPDLKDSARAIAYAAQGGLGLPDRDYYLRDDARSRRLRTQYQAHVARMLGLLGDTEAKPEAAWVLELETQLARASLDRVALREPANSYHIYTLRDADAKTPYLAWSGFFHNATRDEVTSFSLAQPEFFAAADRAIAGLPVTHWQAWLRWRLVDAYAAYLGRAFVDADFDFHGRLLRGAREKLPRWKRVARSADMALGELLGAAYVAEAFPPAAKQRARDLVDNLKVALRARIAALTWMSEPTKRAAYAKLDTLVAKIGYPDRWRDYAQLEISPTSYLANMRAAAAFEARRQFVKVDRPVDRNEWDMTPQTINAYNNAPGNEIVFPAAQLLPPYFDAGADDALNYGGIGAVIGHEMLHSFDDEGSQFDAKGNLADWWTPEDRAAFQARAAKLVSQFNAYVPIDDLHINGQLSLGENIADLGGLLVAYDAFKLTAQGSSASNLIDGLTPDQRFFLAFAQTWRDTQRPAYLRLQLQSDEHAPAKFRVNGPLSNMPAFARAFGCESSAALVRPAGEIVNIW